MISLKSSSAQKYDFLQKVQVWFCAKVRFRSKSSNLIIWATQKPHFAPKVQVWLLWRHKSMISLKKFKIDYFGDAKVWFCSKSWSLWLFWRRKSTILLKKFKFDYFCYAKLSFCSKRSSLFIFTAYKYHFPQKVEVWLFCVLLISWPRHSQMHDKPKNEPKSKK